MSTTNSTTEDRARRARQFARPIQIRVRQTDGSYLEQWVEVSVKTDKRIRRKDLRK